MPDEIIQVLLVEDSPTDVMLTREALSKVLKSLYVVDDGVEALEFLRGEGKYADAPRPGLILLDLNMPRKNGQEVLCEIKADTRLKEIPVVILTTSNAEKDILEAYTNQANCFITKPVDFDAFAKVVRSIIKFWGAAPTRAPA